LAATSGGRSGSAPRRARGAHEVLDRGTAGFTGMEVRGQIWRDAMQMGGPRAEVLKGPGASVAPYTAWTRASSSCQFSRRLQAPPVGCAAAGWL
jgi:hypothetical protein